MRPDPLHLIPDDEGRPHAGRLVVYLTVAALSTLAVLLLPGLDMRDDHPGSARVDTALFAPPPTTSARVPASSLSVPPPPTPAGPALPATGTPLPAADPFAAPAPASLGDPSGGAFSWPDLPAAAPRPVVAPETGVYLGIYHYPSAQGDASLFQILTDLPALNAQMGRTPAIVSVYQPWGEGWVLNDTLAQVADTQGAIPMVSWRCGEANDRIAAGAADATIFAFANQLRDYGRPVLLRWFWEMNLLNAGQCLGGGTVDQQAANYRAAFQRIAAIFDMVGATNVAFIWAPSTATIAGPMEPFYPGDEYVDWIGADGYSRRQLGLTAFSTQFEHWYGLFAGKGKPMIVAETGATIDQVDFLRGMAEVVPRDFPQIKAVVYFDSLSHIDWRLTSYDGAGVPAFAELGRNPYFSVMPVDP
jgi:hypothetical protein